MQTYDVTDDLRQLADDLRAALRETIAQRDELLALLKEMVDGCDEDETDATWLAESRAAIAKAGK